jgi:hypothetical protein
VAELATAMPGADPRLDLELVDDPAASVVDPDDGLVGGALVEPREAQLLLAFVSLHGISPLWSRIGMTSAMYPPSSSKRRCELHRDPAVKQSADCGRRARAGPGAGAEGTAPSPRLVQGWALVNLEFPSVNALHGHFAR